MPLISKDILPEQLKKEKPRGNS